MGEKGGYEMELSWTEWKQENECSCLTLLVCSNYLLKMRLEDL